MKKIFRRSLNLISVIMMICLLWIPVTVQAEESVASGTCGTNLNWSLSGEGVLTISGEGTMNNFASSGQPWYEQRSSIIKVEIEDGVTSIGNYAFQWCSKLIEVTIPDSVQSIGMYAFYSCTNLNNVVIPEGITSIEDYCFYGCRGMVNISIPETVKTIGRYALSECTFGDLVIPESVEQIYWYALYMSYWNSISLPKEMYSVGDYAFSYCGGFKGIITTPVVNTLQQGLYCNCGNLDGVIIPEGVQVISSNVFRYCDFTEIWIPKSVTSISSSAFYGMSLSNLTIYGYAGSEAESFAESKGINFSLLSDNVSLEILVEGEGIVTGASEYEKGTEVTISAVPGETYSFVGWYVNDEVVSENSEYTFIIQEDCVITAKFKTDILESGLCGEDVYWKLDNKGLLTIYGKGAMYDYEVADLNYAPWYEQKSSILAIKIGEGVTHIGDAAFYSCSAAQSADICDSVKTVGKQAFKDSGILNLTMSQQLLQIGEYAFQNTKIDNLNLPEGVVEVGEGAFAKNKKLKMVILPDSLNYIPDKMFSECSYLRTVDFPKMIETIGDEAFVACFELESMVLPEGLISIGERAFGNCGAQDSFAGYYDCNNFTSITFPESLEMIGPYAFSGCQSLYTVNIPDGVKRIEEGAFSHCYRLNTISFSAYIEYLGKDIFWQSEKLTNVTFRWSAPIIENSSFGWVSATCYYPQNNEDWTSDMLKDYAGTLTWVPLEMEKPEGSEGDSGTTGGEGTDEYSFSIKSEPYDQVVEIGSIALFMVEADGDEVIYQWQYSNNNGIYWYNSGMEGCNTCKLSVPVIEKRNGQMYRCIVTDKYGSQLLSDTAILMIIAPNTSITKQPVNQCVNIGDSAVFDVEVEGNGLSYQWQFSKSSGKYWTNSNMEGADTNNLVVPVTAKRDGQMYRCVITEANGNQIISEAATLVVSTESELEITSQPVDQTVKEGEYAEFAVEAVGENLSYQWQYSTSGGKYWTNSGMTGADTNTILVEVIEKRDGQMYRCVIKSASGNQITSEVATLIISNEDKLEITSQPMDCNAKEGEDINFTVTAVGKNLTYQWQYSNNGGTYWYNSGMTGNTTNELTVTALAKRNGQMYRCVITDMNGKEIISNVVTLVVK